MRTLKTSYIIISVLILAASAVGPDISAQSKKRDLAQMPLKDVLLEDENIDQLLARFSFAYNLPLGFELARGDGEPSFYRIDFKKGTLSDLLNQFVTEHNE